MACKECVERREKLIDAVLEGRIAAAAGHAIKGAVEMVGLKPKASAQIQRRTRQARRKA